jgi:hypothetical protein
MDWVMKLEIGKTYKTKNGKIVTIQSVFNGIFHGKIDNVFESFLHNGKNWAVLSQFSSFGSCRDVSNPDLDIIEEITNL